MTERIGVYPGTFDPITLGHADIIRRVLGGEAGPRRDIVLMNAAAALVAGGKARDLKEGVGLAGESIDSHAAVTRFLGISSDVLMDDRLPDTGFEQYGTSVRSNWVPNSRTHVVTSYMRTNQDKGDRYDQLLGGDGNLIAQLNDLSLDLFSVRLERLQAGWFDDASVIYSLNSQREERVNQGGNGNPTATIGYEPERTTVHGMQVAFTKQVSARQSFRMGGDVNFERLTSEAFNVNPVTGSISPRRPRIPDGAEFTQGGVYAQTTVDVTPERFRLVGSLRFGGAKYHAEAGSLWPADALTTSSATFSALTRASSCARSCSAVSPPRPRPPPPPRPSGGCSSNSDFTYPIRSLESGMSGLHSKGASTTVSSRPSGP